MTSVPCNPFSWSAVDRAHRLGLCTLFVREELALPVPLDPVGVYLQFNLEQNHDHVERTFKCERVNY